MDCESVQLFIQLMYYLDTRWRTKDLDWPRRQCIGSLDDQQGTQTRPLPGLVTTTTEELILIPPPTHTHNPCCLFVHPTTSPLVLPGSLSLSVAYGMHHPLNHCLYRSFRGVTTGGVHHVKPRAATAGTSPFGF